MAIFSRVFLPFLLFIYITIETYLKLNHNSICDATGCKLAGELLRFNPLYLNYLGLASVFLLTLLGYFSLKSKLMERLFFMVLYSAIAFEATILGYQFLSNPEPCIFCLGIFSSLLLIAFLSHFRNFPFILSIVLSIFLGLNTLAITKNQSFITKEGTYLIQSKTCSHCKKVKHYLSKEHIAYTPISVEEASARSFLKFAGVSSIPVLVIKNSMGIQLHIVDKKIINYYEKKLVPQSTTSSTSIQPDVGIISTDFLKAGSKSDGCALSIIETTPCADDNISHN
jgi:glutaredoxin